MAGGTLASGRSVTSRALALLGAFDDAHPRLSLTDLARRAGLPLSTTHRLVAELVAWDGLARRTDGRYEIGRRIWDLGLLAPVHRELREVALPFLQDVAAATGRTSTWPSGRARARCTSSGSPGTAAVPVLSAGPAAGCRCTPPASARCCWRTRRWTCRRPCWGR